MQWLANWQFFAIFDFEFASEQETRVRWITAHVCAPTATLTRLSPVEAKMLDDLFWRMDRIGL